MILSRNVNFRSIGLLLLGFVLLVAGCRSLTNYDDPQGPLYEGEFAGEAADFDDVIKVVSWNISHADEIDQAIADLSGIEELQGADFIMLQEMDAAGTEAIAEALGYNYIYYPASVHRDGKDFGNAILSRWPISHPGKLILPHESPSNKQIRIAVKGQGQPGEREIALYNAHTETILLSTRNRLEQIETIIDDFDPDQAYVIAGGDFNAPSFLGLDQIDDAFAAAGMDRVSAGVGDTFKVLNTGVTLDHIFARGMTVLSKGVAEEASASDHLPIWVELKLESGE